jgi:hypothetical protein
MADLHIDDFYKDVARSLTLLYSSFPRKIILYVEDICGPDSPDEFGLHCPRFQSCFSTLIWLADTGYLRYDTCIRQEALDQTCLTHKGFTLLSSRIPTADNQTPPYPSRIDRLRDTLKNGSSFALEEVVQELLNQP